MKCFLSHSSLDKSAYASVIAQKLQPHIEYDEKTFEEGMGNFEEILNALDRSSIFVLLISDNSLESAWVKKEINEANARLERGQLTRFFPIIIDQNISHTDKRIPDWIRENYNLRPITRPSIAAKRIKERLVEASWQSHPMLKKRDQIFVGRNTQIAEFEQRFDDFSKNQPVAVFASGLNEIGRKTTIKHALRKANLVRDTYEPIRIDLSRDDNIEGFILKLYDIGVTENLDVENLLDKSIDDKVGICLNLLNDIKNHKELILIDDEYCIVRYEGEVAPWFENVISGLAPGELMVCVATSSRPKRHLYVKNDRYFFIHIPELEKIERIGLFRRYAELLEINLSQQDFKNFTPLLKGFPEQVTYAVSLIEELGPERAFSNAHEIASFSIYRANIILTKLGSEDDLVQFLRFVSYFEFVSVDFISQIGSIIGKNITDFLDKLLCLNVCEAVGPGANYFRVNEIIRDAIIRDRLGLDENYKAALLKFVINFSESFSSDDFDISEYQIAIKEALSAGIKVPDKLLIPAHFLKTMRQLYDDRFYKEVIVLADRVLQNKDNFDSHTEQDIRYYLCQSLARQQDQRFLQEVQSINGPEHDFLLGFYYRLKRRFNDALPRYKSAMRHQRTEQRARREIVFVLMTTEDFEGAISLARENFERYPRNPYLAQSYFNCLIYHPDRSYAEQEMQKILDALKSMGGARATEMMDNLQARFQFEFGNRGTAFKMIDAAIDRYPEIIYPLLTKLDMATAAEDADLLKKVIAELYERNPSLGHKVAISKAEAVLAALTGDHERAMRMMNKELAELSESGKERLSRKILKLSSR